MKLIVQICVLLNLFSCAVSKKSKFTDHLYQVQGLYRLKNTDCKIVEDRKDFCNHWHYLEVVETANKFAVKTKYSFVLWSKDFETYMAGDLSLKDLSRSSEGIRLTQRSEMGVTKVLFDQSGRGEFLSDYDSPHEGRIKLLYDLKKVNKSKMKIPYPGK